MKIAIIGAGISGLTCAYYLDPYHQITIFEKEDYLGGHAHTVDVTVKGETYALDTGFLVHNTPGYPGFTQLMQKLGVNTLESDMSFSVSQKCPDFEYNGHNLWSLFAQKSNLFNPKFYGLLKDILHFNKTMKSFITQESKLTLAEFLAQYGYGRYFYEYYLRPMLAAIWSAEPAKVFEFPAVFLGRFFDNHGLLQVNDRPIWKTIQGGSREYVRALQQAIKAVIEMSAVMEIQKNADGYSVKTQKGLYESFDIIIMATHSDQALQLYPYMPMSLKLPLQAISYQENEVILHTDVRLMPKRRAAWASWNYSLQPEQSLATVTYYLNRLQRINAPVDFLVTLNQHPEIDAAHILQTFSYGHPIFNQATLAAQEIIKKHNGEDHFYLCGAYLGNGFHEDGVQSALRVCQLLGVACS